MHNVLIIFYIAFSIGNLFILPELVWDQAYFFAVSHRTGKTPFHLRLGHRPESAFV